MKRNSKVLFVCALCILAAIFLLSATALLIYYTESKKSQNTYNELAGMVEAARPTVPVFDDDVPEGSDAPTTPSPYVTVTDSEGNSREVLKEYAIPYELNNHMVGWLRIDGTNINYPVVQTPDSPNYYLRRDFYGNQDTHGCIYAAEPCDINAPSDNITLYGHRMRDGTMFAALEQYTKKAFWEEHPFIQFDTLTQHHTYQILYVFITESTLGEGFQYQAFVNAYDADAFDDFIGTCKKLALYDTGLSAAYGDKLITLSTCDYSLENGRLVVVAKRID